MQLTPATARQLGVRRISDPAQHDNGGATHLRWLQDHWASRVEDP